MSDRILTFRSYHAAGSHGNPKLQSPSFECRSVISVRRKLKIAKIERFSTPFGNRQSAATSRTHVRGIRRCALESWRYLLTREGTMRPTSLGFTNNMKVIHGRTARIRNLDRGYLWHAIYLSVAALSAEHGISIFFRFQRRVATAIEHRYHWAIIIIIILSFCVCLMLVCMKGH